MMTGSKGSQVLALDEIESNPGNYLRVAGDGCVPNPGSIGPRAKHATNCLE